MFAAFFSLEMLCLERYFIPTVTQIGYTFVVYDQIMFIMGINNSLKRNMQKTGVYVGVMGELFKKYKEIFFLVLFYGCICLALIIYYDFSFLYYMMAWNVFLALLPLIFAEKAGDALKHGKSARFFAWLVLWLLFFPNSVYMVTDFIHITSDNFFWMVKTKKYLENSGFIYSTDIAIWIKLLVIGMGFLLSVFLGMESLYLFEQNIKSKVSKQLRYAGFFTVALLSGVGVFIGRFLRFNSWDVILNPVQLLKQFAAAMNVFAIQFIIAYTVYIIGCYLLYRVFRNKPKPCAV